MKQYNSMNTITDIKKEGNSNNEITISNFNDEYNKSTSNLVSRITEDFNTKNHTEESFSTGTYNTKNERHEDFKTFLDSYEHNITKAILIDEMQDNASSYNSSNYNLFVSTFNENERPYLNRDINYGEIVNLTFFTPNILQIQSKVQKWILAETKNKQSTHLPKTQSMMNES